MDLRALLLVFLNTLRPFLAALAQAAKKATSAKHAPSLRPAHGPAHPGLFAFRAARRAPPQAAPPPRPSRPPLPEHLAARLAAAPEVEPEFAPKRELPLLQPFRSIAAHVRIYNPKPRAAASRAPAPRPASPWAARLARAVSRFGSLLAVEGPPRAVGL